jgi:hypothetical protein
MEALSDWKRELGPLGVEVPSGAKLIVMFGFGQT